MKKPIAILLTVVLMCFSLASCDPGETCFTDEYPVEGVIKIELLKYENPDQGDFMTWVIDQTDDLLDHDFSKETVLATLDGDSHAFFTELSQYGILHKYFTYDSPNGMCIKITYDDGKFAIINSDDDSFHGYIGMYNADGSVDSFCGCFYTREFFVRLVENHFDLISTM